MMRSSLVDVALVSSPKSHVMSLTVCSGSPGPVGASEGFAEPRNSTVRSADSITPGPELRAGHEVGVRVLEIRHRMLRPALEADLLRVQHRRLDVLVGERRADVVDDEVRRVDLEGHETSGGPPSTRLSFQSGDADAGFVEVMMRSSSTATHSEADGQEIEEIWLGPAIEVRHASAPPVGSVDVTMFPTSSFAAQKFAEGQDR